ncbi:MAG TPA: class III extradiol ring-cleavage dioxygenase [Moraxellaceae bacterium]|nr:class III extradiol ring-cleavage dioxygenase [Moraxellaceae bacterium]
MFPSLFLSHGSPMLAVEPGVYGAAWRQIADSLPRPEAILMISAHWTSAVPGLSLAPRPETIHDFGGFPSVLYSVRYPAPGAPALAQEAATLLASAGITTALEPDRGLDHGAWVPLLHMYPGADIPVSQMSVQPGKDAAWHVALGRALRPLRERNVLVVGSGSLTHNLHDFDFGEFNVDRALPYVKEFQSWMVAALDKGDDAHLANWLQEAPWAKRAHPTPEHLLPLFVAYGAVGDVSRVDRPLANYSGGALAMDCFVFS